MPCHGRFQGALRSGKCTTTSLQDKADPCSLYAKEHCKVPGAKGSFERIGFAVDCQWQGSRVIKGCSYRCRRVGSPPKGWYGPAIVAQNASNYQADLFKHRDVKLSPGDVVSLNGGKTGQYCADNNAGIKCDRDSVGDTERFTVTTAVNQGRQGRQILCRPWRHDQVRPQRGECRRRKIYCACLEKCGEA